MCRAGTEQGVTKLVSIAEDGIRELKEKIDVGTMPDKIVTQAFVETVPHGTGKHWIEELLIGHQVKGATAPGAQIAFMHEVLAALPEHWWPPHNAQE